MPVSFNIPPFFRSLLSGRATSNLGSQIGSAQVGSAQVGSAQVGSAQVGSAQVGSDARRSQTAPGDMAEASHSNHLRRAHPFQSSDADPIIESSQPIGVDALTHWLDEGVLESADDSVDHRSADGPVASGDIASSNSTSAHLIRAHIAQKIHGLLSANTDSSSRMYRLSGVNLPKALLEIQAVLNDFRPQNTAQRVSIQSKSTQGYTLLAHAARKGAVSSIGLLVALGMDKNQATVDGRSPFFVAAEYGEVRALRKLAALGANVRLRAAGKTPLDVAGENDHGNAVIALREILSSSSASLPRPYPVLQYAPVVRPAPVLRAETVAAQVFRLSAISREAADEASSRRLPVVSSMSEYIEMNARAVLSGRSERRLAPATQAVIEMLQEPEVAMMFGLDCDEVVDSIGELFSRYSIPIGSMSLLLDIDTFDLLQFVVDDSSSMGLPAESAAGARAQSRWNAVQTTLLEMLEFLSVTLCRSIEIRFLNRSDRLLIERRSSDTPEIFYGRASPQVRSLFYNRPQGMTPLNAAVRHSLSQNSGRRVARYVFCDGQPTDRAPRTNRLQGPFDYFSDLVRHRPNPTSNPITLVSFSDEPDSNWMTELASVSNAVHVVNGSYASQASLVRAHHGSQMPYSRGTHLLDQLVGGLESRSFDMLTRQVPLTKPMLENMLGIELSISEYRAYVTELSSAQVT